MVFQDLLDINVCTGVGAALLLVLLFFEARVSVLGKVLVKPFVSLMFMLALDQAGGFSSGEDWAWWIVAAFAGCYLGDMFLMHPSNDVLFRLGIVAFALGHVAYAVAFAQFHFDAFMFLLGSIPCGIFIAAVHQYLIPNVRRVKHRMVIPVRGYMAVIFVMAAVSFGTHSLGFICCAVVFMLSDVFVARSKFVSPIGSRAFIIDRCVSLPMYYGAQFGFAYVVKYQLELIEESGRRQ